MTVDKQRPSRRQSISIAILVVREANGIVSIIVQNDSTTPTQHLFWTLL